MSQVGSSESGEESLWIYFDGSMGMPIDFMSHVRQVEKSEAAQQKQQEQWGYQDWDGEDWERLGWDTITFRYSLDIRVGMLSRQLETGAQVKGPRRRVITRGSSAYR